MRKCIMSIVLILSAMTLSGCVNQQNKNYDITLSEYLPVAPERYLGENEYEHVINSVTREEKANVLHVKALGEIKDSSIGVSNKKFDFSLEFDVTDLCLYQTVDNPLLNDSEFKEIELLRLPLAEGATWKFTAKRFDGKKESVEATIVAVDSEAGTLEVEYVSGDYIERRILKKNLGTTDFTKSIVFKSAKAVSGYHLDLDSKAKSVAVQSEMIEFNAIKEISVSQRARQLICDFNDAYISYASGSECDIEQYLCVDSPAIEKIKSINSIESNTVTFLGLKAVAERKTDKRWEIDVAELTKLGEEEELINRMTYTIVEEDGLLKIYDFE